VLSLRLGVRTQLLLFLSFLSFLLLFSGCWCILLACLLGLVGCCCATYVCDAMRCDGCLLVRLLRVDDKLGRDRRGGWMDGLMIGG
jgi:hypothetical protein